MTNYNFGDFYRFHVSLLSVLVIYVECTIIHIFAQHASFVTNQALFILRSDNGYKEQLFCCGLMWLGKHVTAHANQAKYHGKSERQVIITNIN